MDGFSVYRHYCAIKAHFNGKYDYIKYGGRITATHKSYNRRSDKPFFEILAKKNMAYIVPYLVSNFVNSNNLWIGDLIINIEADDVFHRWRKKITRLFMESEEEMTRIKIFLESRHLCFNDLFEVKEDELPILFRLMIQEFISFETYIVMNEALGFQDMFDNKIIDNVIYSKWARKVDAYRPFLELPREKCKTVVRLVFL